MTSSTRLALLLGLQLAAGAAFVACGSDAEPADTKPAATDDPSKKPVDTGDPLELTPSPLYSAYVEGHEATVAVTLKDASLKGKGAKFTSSDPTIATVADSTDGATVTVKKDGTVTITGTLDGATGKARLTIKKFTEDQWKTGQARYSKTDRAVVDPNGGEPTAITIATPGARNANGACNTCHTSQAQLLKIENGPLQIAGYSDDDLITIFTMGKKPEGAAMKTQIPAFFWGMFHSWTVTEDEKQGLIAYLRTQPAKANGTIDYGVMPCPGTTTTDPTNIKLCDRDGKPVTIPGQGGTTTTTTTGTDAGAAKPATDAGTTTTTTTADAGVAAGDAG
jgi:hypothetical protein